MDEMQELLDEMESYSDVTRGAGKSEAKHVADKDPPPKSVARGGGDAGRGMTMPMMRGKAKPPAKAPGKAKKHASYGRAPVGLLAEFLVLVSSGKMQEALELSNEILKFEPDNPLIKMYQEAMREYVQLGLQEEGAEDSESDGGEEDGEGKSDGDDDDEEKEGDDNDDDDDDDDDEDEEEDDDEEEDKKRVGASKDFEERKRSDEGTRKK